MKSIILNILVIITLIAGCDIFKDENDACDDTKWEAPEEPIVTLRLNSTGNFFDGPNHYYLFSAVTANVSGSITKVYCSGETSGSFDFNTFFYPRDVAYNSLLSIKIGQDYQFKFENDLDYLQLLYRAKFSFDDGKIFESNEIITKVYYSDIVYDVNTMENKILMDLTATSFFEVTE